VAQVTTEDGTSCERMVYKWRDWDLNDDPRGPRLTQLRGVCSCMEHKPEVRRRDFPTSKRQLHQQPAKHLTLIPWSLPHTGYAHNQWTGLYSRVMEAGFTATIITTPALIGKQGQWLHPAQDRLISVREAARAQGFPDHYLFSGGPTHRYQQVGECTRGAASESVVLPPVPPLMCAGNAVPPPLARALASEIAKAVRIGKAAAASAAAAGAGKY